MRNIVTVGQMAMTEQQEMAVCQDIGNLLHVAYPGHIWAVTTEQGVATIQLLYISGKWGFRIKLSELDPEGKKIVMAGGELLERYGLSRAQRTKQVADEMANMKRDIAGEGVLA